MVLHESTSNETQIERPSIDPKNLDIYIQQVV